MPSTPENLPGPRAPLPDPVARRRPTGRGSFFGRDVVSSTDRDISFTSERPGRDPGGRQTGGHRPGTERWCAMHPRHREAAREAMRDGRAAFGEWPDAFGPGWGG